MTPPGGRHDQTRLAMGFSADILITCAGRRVELVRCFAAARDALGFGGRVLCGDADPSAPALHAADAAFALPRIDSGRYVDALAEIVRRERVALVVPTIDTELPALAEARAGFEAETGARLLVSPPECIRLCRDKALTAAFLARNGFAHPRVFSPEELATSQDLPFPLFIKPRGGSSSIGAFKVPDRRALDFFLGYVPDPIVQSCATGQEYSVDAFLDFGGRVVSAVPRRRLAIRAGEILKGRIDLNPKIVPESRRLLKCLGAIGPVTIQGFLGDDGVFQFTEVNPRFGGGAPMSIAAGADSCRWLYLLLAGQPLPPFTVRDGAAFARFDQMVETTDSHFLP